MPQVPRLPRETSGHAKRRWMSPSATPAKQNVGGYNNWENVYIIGIHTGCNDNTQKNKVPRLPRKTKVDVSKCHACHAKCRGAPGDERRPSTPPCRASPVPQAPRLTPNAGSCRQVQRLPRKWNVDVTSSTPATQMERRCHQVPRLPHKVPRRPGRLTVTKHATRASPVPQVPRLPRKENVCDVTKCHTCQAKRRWMSPSLPRKVPRCHRRPAPATQRECGCLTVPRLPRKTKVNVAKCHACHVKRRWMSPSATPATRPVP